MTARPRILLIEDDLDLVGVLSCNLNYLGYEVHAETTGRGGVHQLETRHWDTVLLDLILPDIDGKEVCAKAQSLAHYTPVIVATARAESVHRIECYALGADDYLVKPYSIDELLARMSALDRRIRRIRTEARQTVEQLQLGELRIEFESRTVWCGELRIDLTPREFELLLLLARHPNKVFTRSDLLDKIWGPNCDAYEHTVVSHVNRLRNKLARNGLCGDVIQTVWGLGYRAKTPDF
jgi:two-component system, OmpR family, response regulator